MAFRAISLGATAAVVLLLRGANADEERAGHLQDPAVQLAAQSTTSAPFSAGNIEDLLWSNMDDQLHSPKFQWVNALVFLIFGKLMLWDGLKSLKWTILALSWLVFYFLAMSQIHESGLGDKLGWLCSVIVGIECGFLFAVVVWYGYDAVKYVMGAMLGVIVSTWLVGKASVHISEDLATNKWFLFIVGNFCILGGIFLLHEGKTGEDLEQLNVVARWLTMAHHATAGKFTKLIMTIICSFFGGLLVTASVSYFCGVLATFWADHLAQHGIIINEDSPRGGFWIDYLLTITSPHNPDKGVFSSTPKGFSVGATFYNLDCVIGRSGWLIFFGLGVLIWYLRNKRDKKRKAAAAELNKTKAESKPKAKAQKQASLDVSRGNAVPPPAKTQEPMKKSRFAFMQRSEKSEPLLG